MTKRKRSKTPEKQTTTTQAPPTKKPRLSEPAEEKHRTSLLGFVDKFKETSNEFTNSHLTKAKAFRDEVQAQVLRILVYGKQGQGKSHTLNVITVGTSDGPLPYGQTMVSVTSAPIYIKPRFDNMVLVMLDMMTLEEAKEWTNLKEAEIEGILQKTASMHFQRDTSFTWERVRKHMCSFDIKTLACVKQIRLEYAYHVNHQSQLIDFPGEGHTNKYVKPEYLKKQRIQAMQDANVFFFVDARTPTEENYKTLIEESQQSLFHKALIQIFRQDFAPSNTQTMDTCNASSIGILESLAYNSSYLPSMTPRAKLESFNSLMNNLRTEPSYKFTDTSFVLELCQALKEHIVNTKMKDYISAMSVFVYLVHGVEKQQLKYHQKLVKNMCMKIEEKFGFKPIANNAIAKQTKKTIATFVQQNNGKTMFSLQLSMLKDLFGPCFHMMFKDFEEKLNSNIAIYAKNMVYKQTTKFRNYIKFEQIDISEFDDSELNEYNVVRVIVLDDFRSKGQEVLNNFVDSFNPSGCKRTQQTIKVKHSNASSKQELVEQISNEWSAHAVKEMSILLEDACKKAWENLSNNMALRDTKVDSDDESEQVIQTTTTMKQWKLLLKSNYKIVHQIERFVMPIFSSNDRYAYTIDANQVCNDMLAFSHSNHAAVKCASQVHVECVKDLPANHVTFKPNMVIHAMVNMNNETQQRLENHVQKVKCMFNASTTEQTIVLAPILVIVNSLKCFEFGKLSKSEFDNKPHLLMLAVEEKNVSACMKAHPNAIVLSFPNNYLHPVTVLDCFKLFMEKLECPIYFHIGQNASYFSELCVQSMKARECTAARGFQFLQTNLHKVVYNAKQRMQALLNNNEKEYCDKALDAIAGRTCGKEVLTRFLDLQKKVMVLSPREIEDYVASMMDCAEKTQIASLQAKYMLASVIVDNAKYVIPSTLANFPNIYKVTTTTMNTNASLHMTDAQRGVCYSGEGKIVWQTNKMEFKNFNKELLKVQQSFANMLNSASVFCYGFSVRNSEYKNLGKK